MESIGFILQFVADTWIIACHLIEGSPLNVLKIQVREAMSSLPELSKLELKSTGRALLLVLNGPGEARALLWKDVSYLSMKPAVSLRLGGERAWVPESKGLELEV